MPHYITKLSSCQTASSHPPVTARKCAKTVLNSAIVMKTRRHQEIWDRCRVIERRIFYIWNSTVSLNICAQQRRRTHKQEALLCQLHPFDRNDTAMHNNILCRFDLDIYVRVKVRYDSQIANSLIFQKCQTACWYLVKFLRYGDFCENDLYPIFKVKASNCKYLSIESWRLWQGIYKFKKN